jgi:hypothetical protein
MSINTTYRSPFAAQMAEAADAARAGDVTGIARHAELMAEAEAAGAIPLGHVSIANAKYGPLGDEYIFAFMDSLTAAVEAHYSESPIPPTERALAASPFRSIASFVRSAVSVSPAEHNHLTDLFLTLIAEAHARGYVSNEAGKPLLAEMTEKYPKGSTAALAESSERYAALIEQEPLTSNTNEVAA